LPVCLITLLSTSGWAWGQAGNTLKEEPQKQFLQPYSPESNNQSLDASFKTNTIDANKRNIGKTSNKPISSATPKSSKPTHGHHQKSEIQPDGLKKDATGTVFRFQRYNQGRTAGSGSFLDGYLLKSLHEERIVRKKAADDSTSDEDLLKKNKGPFLK